MSSKSRFSRRQFIGTAAVAAGVTIVPRFVLGGPKFVAPSEKVNVAVIGCGGQGRTNIRDGLFRENDCQVIAIADPAEKVDQSKFYYGGLSGRGPVGDEVEKHYSEKTPNYKCARYEDFRQMLEKEKSIDAVLIATPDHNHAYVAIAAMRAGKHVYCEKPMAHNIYEVRLMAKIAKELGLATQMGNQGHSGEGLRQTAEWIWDGAIGQIKEVHSFSSAGKFVRHPGRPADEPIPAGINWDLWLGTRSERPYNHEYLPFNWRGYWAFGSAALGDMACHNMDPAVFALKLERAEWVQSEATEVDPETTQDGARTTWFFGPRGDMPAVTMHWYDGSAKVPTPEGIDPKDPKQRMGDGGNGLYFVGEKGIITCAGWAGAPRLLPLTLKKQYDEHLPAKTIPRVKGHHADWLAAAKGGKQSSANFEYSARLTEIVLLGNVAVRTKKKIEWDYDNMKAKGVPEADAIIKEEYRKGWEVA